MIANLLRAPGLVTLLFLLPTTAAKAQAEELTSEDWAGLRAAYEVGRYAVSAVDGGYRAHNPGQRWVAHFDGRGVCVEPDAGDWSWGLELERYGFAGEERAVTEPALVSAEEGRVVYAWEATLEEWYLSDRRGLEHGYTVHRRPPGGDVGSVGPLSFTLRIRGALHPQVIPGGRGVRFLDGKGAVVLTYTGLHVYDADGRALDASFECLAEGLRLSIDERAARYPLTIDPVAQQAYLKASNTGVGDNFGRSIAVSGDTAVVGAWEEDSNATGVNGAQANNGAPEAGAAYVFVRDGTGWSQQAYLKASNTGSDDRFGNSVSVSGDTVVIGAWKEDSNATGVNGDQADNSAPDAGAAYVFVRSGTSWSQQAYLKASNTEAYDAFGESVSVSGDTLVVGAAWEDSDADGVDGNQADNSATGAGAVYIFVRGGTIWHQWAYLKASNSDANDHFGESVASSDETVVVAAAGEASSATGVNGDQNNNDRQHSGAAYVFRGDFMGWSQQAYLKASNTQSHDEFGYSVAVSGDTVVVGAVGEDSSATGVGGDQNSNQCTDAGAAYVFVRDGTSWSQQAYLKASNTDIWNMRDHFGGTVAVSGDTAVVCAYHEDSDADGVNGDQGDNSAPNAGAAYAFIRRGSTWIQDAYLKASNSETNDTFGASVAVSGSTILIGAHYEDSSATGVGGDQQNNNAYSAGAAYAFARSARGVPFCFGAPGSGTPCPCGNDNDGSVAGAGCANGVFPSGAQLVEDGAASLGADTLVLRTTGLEPNNAGLYFQADNDLSPGNVWGDGLRCAGGGLIRLGVRFSDGAGYSDTSGYPETISARAGNIDAGDTKYYQCWYRNPIGSPCATDFNASNGLALTWVP